MKLLNAALFVVLLFLISCDVAKYTATSANNWASVSVEYSPRRYFKPDTTTILVINQFDLSKRKNITKRKADALKAGAFTSIKYAATQLRKLPHVHVINIVDSTNFMVSTDSIKYLALKYHSDYVLVLKNFSAGINLTDIQGSATYYERNVAVDFLLYESNGIYFKKLNGSVAEPQSEGVDFGLIGNLIAQPTVGGNKGDINAAAIRATQIAIQDYFPATISHNRPLYTDEVLKPSVKEILAGNYDKADSLLQPILKDQNVQIASKAAYHMAIVYEAEGDIGAAIDVAQLSLDKFKNNYAEVILADLKEE